MSSPAKTTPDGGRASQAEPGSRLAGSAGGLRLLDVPRLLREPPPPIEWRVEGLAIDGCVTMLAGREGLGKSMLALALACAVTRGDEAAGMNCRSGRALVVDVENGEYEARRRLHGLRPDPDSLYYSVDSLRLPEQIEVLDKTVRQVGPQLIVLDSLRPMSGGADENDSRMDAVLTPLRDATREWNAALILLHHAPKSGDDYRGSTAIGAAVELGFTMSGEARLAARRLRCWKSRPAPEPADRWIDLREGSDGAPEFAQAQPAAAREKAGPEMGAKLVAALAHGPMRRCELAEAVGESRETTTGTFGRAISAALERGAIIREGHGVYALARGVASDGQG